MLERKETPMTAMIHSDIATTDTPRARLRLTRRGRVVFGTLAVAIAVTVLAMVAMFGASHAQASTESVESVGFEYVVAEPGDSLWTLASRVAPGTDARDVIYDIKRLNQLDQSDLYVGQELAIPLKYAE